MRIIACYGLCLFISGLCISTTAKTVDSGKISFPRTQHCLETIEYVADTESGRPSNSWRGLVPLKSTRSEVEVLFVKQ